MAKFIQVAQLNGDGHFLINIDLVRYVQPHISESDRCVIWFDKEQGLSIGEGAAAFLAKADRA